MVIEETKTRPERRLRHKKRPEDMTMINFQGFELTFLSPNLKQLSGLTKYADLGEGNMELSPDGIMEIIEVYVDLFVPSELDTRDDFKEYLTELPIDLFQELTEQISSEVFEKHQKKAQSGLENSSTPMKESP